VPVEIERKFLVVNRDWYVAGSGTLFRQGYLCIDPARTVRIRLAGDAAFVTIKGISRGASRAEYEYAIPADEARELLEQLCLPGLIEKTRYRVAYAGLLWEVDEFSGDNAGLVVAEVELDRETQALNLPGWVGEEVTGDERYYNASLVTHPFCDWEQ